MSNFQLEHEQIERQEQFVKRLLADRKTDGSIKSRESTVVEFKQAFIYENMSKYAKTMAAFANNSGGYIIFGITDSPRTILGVNSNFDNIKQEKVTSCLNSMFHSEIIWNMGTVSLDDQNRDGSAADPKRVGWIYVFESDRKPVVAQNAGDKIAPGDIFYRYRARTDKIKPADLERIIPERVTREKEGLFRLMEAVRRSGTASLGIVNYSSGRLSTPYGVDVEFDRKLVAKVLGKAKYIKTGSFSETDGAPVIRVTGDIDLAAEEVPVPEGNPDDTHPYIQKQMADILSISSQDLYALIWHFKMKESKKYHLEIAFSKSGKTHKFSKFALEFLKEKLNELKNDKEEFDRIRAEYKNRPHQTKRTKKSKQTGKAQAPAIVQAGGSNP